MTNVDVLVAGAGPTGLALACGLAAAGVEVRVVDAADGPATTSRALGLQPRGVEVLDRLGALGDLTERGLPVESVSVHVAGRELARLRVGQRTRLGARPALLMSQATVEEALRARLASLGGTVAWNQTVVGVHTRPAGVTVRLAGGEDVEAGWVVGCDGAHSRVRAEAGIGFPGVPLGERFLLADVEANLPLPRDTVAVWLDGEELVAAFPLPGADRWRLMGPAPDQPDADHLDGAAVLDRLTAMLGRHAGVPPTAVRSASWTSTFRFHRRLAQRYRAGRILLAGDAAHIHSPFGGQGMNTGIGDAENLAWKLALVVHGRAGVALLDTYEAERRPVAEEVLAATTGITRAMLGGGPAARLLRDHVVVPLISLPRVQRLIAERASQLLVTYRGGPLGARSPWPRPRPGDRVRDLPVRAADGRTTRLHAELGPRWAVVAADPQLRAACAAMTAARLPVVAPHGTGVASLSPDGSEATPVPRGEGRTDALVVRPDGHLGWRGRDAADLGRWLDAALGSAVSAGVPARS